MENSFEEMNNSQVVLDNLYTVVENTLVADIYRYQPLVGDRVSDCKEVVAYSQALFVGKH